jgi:hypothetical protein
MKRVESPAEKGDDRIGKDGRYKLSAGPGNNFPLIVNGMTRELSLGKTYNFSENDYGILTEAGYTLDLVD